jgi:hypothetical protein
MIPVYETERFRREARRAGLENYAEELRSRLRRDPDLRSHFDSSLPARTWCVIKRQRGHVVGRMKTVELPDGTARQDVFCLLRVFNFDDPERGFIVGPGARQRVLNLPEGIDEPELKTFVASWNLEREEREAEKARALDLAPLPLEYAEWLTPSRWVAAGEDDPFDLVVYETKLWRQRMPSIKAHWSAIHAALGPFLWNDLEGKDHMSPHPEGERGAYVVETDRRVTIFCIYREIESTPQRRLLMLVDALDGNDKASDKDAWLVETVASLGEIGPHDTIDSRLVVNHYGRRSVRAYAGKFLDESKFASWKVIEEDDSANLALSPEEEDLLARLTHTAGQEALPAFINGRAGSGKSTVLYYLFAHYWMHGRKGHLPGQPVFLTLNGRLLKTARECVTSIVSCDSRYLEKVETEEERAVLAGLSEAFLPFRTMLQSVLPPERSGAYAQDHEIDFEAFRRLLLREDDAQYPPRARYKGKLDSWCSPELCWHVIRSYIKGFSPEGFMTANDYTELPKMDRSVENVHFKWVSERVWPWYLGLTVQGEYWDQLDLAREVLVGLKDGSLVLPANLRDCAAVFCDEAQDLTGVELSLVLQLSCFSRHDIRGVRPIQSLPFAFAGDPLQTINPSGFRWENLTSSFYRNLLEPLALERPLAKSELHYNYRSPRDITRIANLVQFHRRAVFHDNYLKPQEPWSLNPGVQPTRCRIRDAFSDAETKALRDSFILLPCAEGREREFAERFPVLKTLEGGPDAPSLLSVMAAKGSDLKRVIVFGFGEALFGEGIRQGEEADEKLASHIGLSYALNQLYVAVTRSTDELVLMDTDRGHRMLWDQLFDPSRIEQVLTRMDEDAAASWRAVLPDGPIPLWEGDVPFAPLTVEELKVQADSLKAFGRDHRRVDFMEKAAAFYRRANRPKDARECKAHALWYSGRWREASAEFLAMENRPIAEDCLWEGRVWDGLVELGASVAPHRGMLARFMVAAEGGASRLQVLMDEMDRNGVEAEPPSHPQWRDAGSLVNSLAREVVGGTVESDQAEVQPGFYLRLGRLLHSLGRLGHQGCLEPAADVYGRAGAWDLAQKVLDDLGVGAKRVSTRDLILAHCTEWPQYVRHCFLTKSYDLFWKRWTEDGRPMGTMSREEAGWVFDMLTALSEHKEAIRVGFAEELVQKLSESRARLSLADQVKLVGLQAKKDRAGSHLEEGLAQVWERRSEFNSQLRLEFAEACCAAGNWERVAEVAQNLLEGRARALDIDGLCDLVAAYPQVARLPEVQFEARNRIGEAIVGLARKAGTAWPANETSLLRAAAALECIGLDKYMTALGRHYAESRSEPIRALAIRIFLRGRSLYEERQSHKVSQADVEEMKQETAKSLRNWRWDGPIDKPGPFLAPPRIAVSAPKTPFEKCGTVVQETEEYWVTVSSHYSVEVSKSEHGGGGGTIEIRRRDRRRASVFVDANAGQVELSNGKTVSVRSGDSVRDGDIGVELEFAVDGATIRSTIRAEAWPDGLVIALPLDGAGR